MNCHLAAGHSNVNERNADMATIVRDAEFPAVATSRGTLKAQAGMIRPHALDLTLLHTCCPPLA